MHLNNTSRNGAYYLSAYGLDEINKGSYLNSGQNKNIQYVSTKCESNKLNSKFRNQKLLHNNCVLQNK